MNQQREMNRRQRLYGLSGAIVLLGIVLYTIGLLHL